MLEWRNWQTQQAQNVPPVPRRGGSTPPSSTRFFRLESVRDKPPFSSVPWACRQLLRWTLRFENLLFRLLRFGTDRPPFVAVMQSAGLRHYMTDPISGGGTRLVSGASFSGGQRGGTMVIIEIRFE